MIKKQNKNKKIIIFYLYIYKLTLDSSSGTVTWLNIESIIACLILFLINSFLICLITSGRFWEYLRILIIASFEDIRTTSFESSNAWTIFGI